MSTKKSQTEISGLLGEQLKVRKLSNMVLVKNRPKRKMGPPSEKQVAVQDRFLEATSYAKGQMEDPESEAMYARGITDKKRSAFAVALNDYLNAPEVNAIKTRDYHGAAGDVIKVHATDDFKVVRVAVIIQGSDGQTLEQGDAVQTVKHKHIWKYTATVANPGVTGSKIVATAFDMPDNETTLEIVL